MLIKKMEVIMKKSIYCLLQKNNTGKALTLALSVFVFLFSACNKDLPSELYSNLIKKGKSPDTPDIIVNAGSSIQAAINQASAGSVILIKPGIYKEAIRISKSNITLIGADEAAGVILENPGEEDNGIFVDNNGDGFQLYHITVKNFEENGVLMIRADNFILKHVTAINCGEYGLFPIHCKGGLIEHCSATGHTDTGVYIGQSEDIEMKFNEAFANVNGFEIENCSGVIASNNQSYNNTAGFLVVLLPNLQVTTSSDIQLIQNHVYGNNHENFSEPGGGFENLVPVGSGILIVGTDNTLVIKNNVHDNNFTGIAVVSTTILGAIGGIPPEAFATIEPNPDNVKVKDNIIKHNGTNPPPLPLPGVDLLWDGSGTGNCWSSNNYTTSYPLQLPSCP